MSTNEFVWINDTDETKITWWKLKLIDVRNSQDVCSARSLVSEKLEDIIFRQWKIVDLSRITWIIAKKCLIQLEKEPIPKTLCCMDDRVDKWDDFLSIAWSWILIVKDLISKWYKWNEIISYLKPIFVWNNIKTITSHQDCWAWWLFYNFLVEYFKLWKNDSLKYVVKELETIFPWILDIVFDEPKMLISWKEDLVAALVLKYISLECNIWFWHIELWKNFYNIPDHESRSIVIDLSSFNLNWFFKKTWIKPWYLLDASMFLDNIELIEKITEEAIIWKLIAKKEPWICDVNKMIVSITIEKDNEQQEYLAKKIIDDINYDIDKNYHELIWKFEITIIKIPKIKD